MKAVIYHAFGRPETERINQDTYKRLFEGFKANVHPFDIEVIHLTLEGFEGFGDTNIFYPGLKSKDVVLNREICFSDFLECAEDDIYWFTEPDARIVKLFPSPDAEIDCVMLYRNDSVPMTPSFRIARKSALPLFLEFLEEMYLQRSDWDGDSDAFTRVHRNMGSPEIGKTDYKGMKIEFRNWKNYSMRGSVYVSHYKGESKSSLL